LTPKIVTGTADGEELNKHTDKLLWNTDALILNISLVRTPWLQPR
jgi:hypothetical protein